MTGRTLLTTDAVGGVWSYSLAVAAGFADAGRRCLLAVLGPSPTPDQRRAAQAIAGLDLHDTGLPLEWTAPDAGVLEDAAGHLDAMATAFDADGIHLHSPALAAFRWRRRPVAVAHSCVGTWWRAVHGSAGPPRDFDWRMRVMHRGLRRAAVIAPSAAFAAALQDVYGSIADLHVVHNGLASPRDLPLPAVARARRVVTAGRLWDAGKNMQVLDIAAARTDVPIDAAGPVAGEDGRLVRFTRLNTLGTLPGPVLHDRVRHAAIFAAPSKYEPFGLAVLEAAWLGTPLVLADIPTFRELWDGAAVFLPPDDAAAWATELGALADDPPRRDVLGRQARARARRYSRAAMVQATLNVHRAALAAA